MATSIFLISLILLIWYKTEAFIAYTKLFNVDWYFYVNKWEEFKHTQDATVNYHQYLRLISSNKHWLTEFFIKLITCPICLAVWLAIPSIFFYSIAVYPIICVMSLVIYYGIVKLMS